VALALLATGCGPVHRERGETDAVTESSEKAESDGEWTFEGGLFSGVLPCASCPGIRTQIGFLADGTYRRRRTYLEGRDGKGRSSGDYGRWAATPGGRLVLRSTEGDVVRFEILGADEIRLLDLEGEPIETELNYNLKAEARGSQELGPYSMSGMYTYFADAAIFRPCNMHRTIPVAMVERHVDLEQAYLGGRASPGAPLLVRIDARLENQPTMEGDQMQESVVVTNVDQVVPGASCLDQAALTDSLGWMLVELDGLPIERPDAAMLPSLTFGPGRVTGSTGCNRLTGPYQTAGDSLDFGALAVTRKACPDTLESAFVDVLDHVDAFRIYGFELDFASQGHLVATFERRPPG